MSFKQLGLLLSMLFLTAIAGAGAWDVGPFDNDDALDWVWELESSDDLSALEAALRAGASEGSYIEAPTGSVAIAAAEVVAALTGNPLPQLPDEVVSWTSNRSLSKDSELVRLARKVIAAVQNSTNSELAELWSESGELFEIWTSGLSDLQQRLQ